VRLSRQPLANLEGRRMQHWGGATGHHMAKTDFNL
jgi:hypothetical protein